jgi:hypothetical protein
MPDLRARLVTMRLHRVVAVGLSLIVMQIGTQSTSSGATLPSAKKYSNCTALNKDYPGGVANSAKAKNKGGKTKLKPKVSAALYKANSTKDRDGDGIACEK